MSYGFNAVLALLQKGYDFKTVDRIYEQAILSGKKMEEITEEYLLQELKKIDNGNKELLNNVIKGLRRVMPERDTRKR